MLPPPPPPGIPSLKPEPTRLPVQQAGTGITLAQEDRTGDVGPLGSLMQASSNRFEVSTAAKRRVRLSNRPQVLRNDTPKQHVPKALQREDSENYWTSEDEKGGTPRAMSTNPASEAHEPIQGTQTEAPGDARDLYAGIPATQAMSYVAALMQPAEISRTRKRQRINSLGEDAQGPKEAQEGASTSGPESEGTQSTLPARPLQATAGGLETTQLSADTPPPYMGTPTDPLQAIVQATLSQIILGIAGSATQPSAAPSAGEQNREDFLAWLTSQVRATYENASSTAPRPALVAGDSQQPWTAPRPGLSAQEALEVNALPPGMRGRTATGTLWRDPETPTPTLRQRAQPQTLADWGVLTDDARAQSLTRRATTPAELLEDINLFEHLHDPPALFVEEGDESTILNAPPHPSLGALGLDLSSQDGPRTERADGPVPMEGVTAENLGEPQPSLTDHDDLLERGGESQFMPTPAGGFPAIELDHPGDRLRNISMEALRRWKAAPRGRRFVIDVFGPTNLNATALCDMAEKLEAAITAFTGVPGVVLIQPTKPHGPFDPRQSPITWVGLGLPEAAVARAVEKRAISSPDISFFVHNDFYAIPTLLFALKGFVQLRDDAATKEIKDILKREPFNISKMWNGLFASF
ncbi:hypothetical protein ACG7TL_006603 [Trametes sanguinea]